MRCDQANSIPAQLYLQYKGFRPSHTRLNGRELWYVSPIRSKEHTPSFKVDVILNRWFDHGLGKGGKTLDLAIEICRCSVREALSDIERSGLFNDLGHSKNQTATLEHVGSVFEQRTIADEKENKPEASRRQKPGLSPTQQRWKEQIGQAREQGNDKEANKSKGDSEGRER